MNACRPCCLHRFVIPVAMAFCVPAFAQSTWDGGVGNWSDANWDTGSSHGGNVATFIDGGSTGTNSAVTLDVSANISSLLLDSGDSLIVATPNVLGVSGDLDSAGTLDVAGTITANTVNINDGVLQGTGLISATVNVVGGSVNPGTSPGIMSIGGNFVNTDFNLNTPGTINFELGGLTPGNGVGFHDQLLVDDNAFLNGIINIVLFGGFIPPAGISEYDVLIAGIITTDSDLQFNFPTLDGVSFSQSLVFFNDEERVGLRITADNIGVIPEPTSLSILALGGAMMLRRRRQPCR